MSMKPFSVCMCVYGGDDPRWFRAAVASILDQTAPPDEVVLVVDGPVPEALEDVVRWCEGMPIFRVIRLEKNRGHGIARRTGLENCTHELVALMDADDLSLPDRFRQQLAVFGEMPGVSVVGGQIAEFTEDPARPVGLRQVPLADGEIRTYLKTRCPMNQVTVMFRRADVQAAGGFLDWYCNEDYYLWIRMYEAGMKFANVPQVLVNVRVGADMYQRRGGGKYFASELRLQNYMLRRRIIGPGTWAVNVAKRLVVQVLLPNRLRGWVFRRFARTEME